MKNIIKKFGIAAMVAVIGFAMIACSNPSGSNTSSSTTPSNPTPSNPTPDTPTPGITITVSTTAEWNAALNTIKNGGDGTTTSPKTYTITVNGDVEVPGSNYYGSFGTVSDVVVTINGNGKLYIMGQGSMLIISGSSQTVYIDSASLTLQGLKVGQNDSALSNNSAVITIESGVLELRNGTIRDNYNTNSNSYGGGVYIGGGSFTMTGGTINNNTNSIGGGVYIGGGSFTMTGGTINNNTSGPNQTQSFGGGVCISGGASFIMSGGTISNNTIGFVPQQYAQGCQSYGGGVCIYAGGSFTMSGGTISGNTVRGGYNLENELIHQGIITEVGGFLYVGGGGVCIYLGGSFIKSNGGIISENNSNGTKGKEVMEFITNGTYRYRNTMLDTADNISTNTQTGWNM